MQSVFQAIASYDNMIELISCVFGILALAFTLYFWLLDHLSEDESKFIEGKKDYLKNLKDYLYAIGSVDEQSLLSMVEDVNGSLEVILNYRFWVHGRHKDEHKKLTEFYQDSKYLISTIRRDLDAQGRPEAGKSLVSIPPLDDKEIEDIKANYKNGLIYIIHFIENWD